MATGYNTLYPPQVDTFMPAFVNTEDAIVSFSISPYNSVVVSDDGVSVTYEGDIQKIHVVLLDQKTNQDAFTAISRITDVAIINSTLIIPFTSDYVSYDAESDTFSLAISPSYLKNADEFKINQYYKVQLRFDSYSGPLHDNYLIDHRKYFSEWSSICLIRPISQPDLHVSNFTYWGENEEGATAIKTIDNLVFNQGSIPISGELFNKDGDEEYLQSYRFTLVDRNNNTVYQSEERFTESPDYQLKDYLDAENTKEGESYSFIIDCTTNNQYSFSKTFALTIARFEQNDTIKFAPTITIQENTEDGYVTIHVAGFINTVGTMRIKRASSVDEFKTWEVISSTIEHDKIDKTIIDNTVGSLIRYKYSAQFEYDTGIVSPIIYSEYVYPTFYDMLLSDKDVQLAIRYNGQISSLKPIGNRVKIDPLGSKYPRFAENAKLNYKQFAISGLISAEGDFNRLFLSELDDKYETEMRYYDERIGGTYMIRNDTMSDGVQETGSSYHAQDRLSALQNTTHDTYPHENWYWERTFREEVIKWLNNGEPKLFRSMPEGNMLVMITDANLTSNQNIGRLLYTFTANAYEIGDGYSLNNIAEAKAYSIPNEKYAATGKGNLNSINAGSVAQIGQLYQNTSGLDLVSFVQKNTEEQSFGVFSGRVMNTGSFRFTNVKIQFNSSPLYYEKSSINSNILKPAEDESNAILGYAFSYHEYGKVGEESSSADIFVNANGYYQFPSGIEIDSLTFRHGDIVTVDYIAEYNLEHAPIDISLYTAIQQVVLGQYSGIFKSHTYLRKKMCEKYEFSQYKNEELKIYQAVNYFAGVSFDVTPYAVVAIQPYGEDDFEEHVISGTGVYHLMPNYNIEDFYFRGRRMMAANSPVPDGWEFILENTEPVSEVTNPKQNHVYNINGTYKIYYIDNQWHQFEFEGKSFEVGIADVDISGYINYRGDLIRSYY